MMTAAAAGGPVHVTRHEDVLVLTIDNPPVNASSAAVRRGLMDGIRELVEDSGLTSAVLVGAHGTFVAGSDITEFSGVVPDPLLPALIGAIESCPKPVVAALDGFALGGGLELALGCDLRVATGRTQVGLPEVTLGMVPGAGGTQRLPRLAGRSWALEMIVTGRRIPAAEALEVGVVDAVVATDSLLAEAVRRSRTTTKRRVAQLPVPDDDTDEFEALAERMIKLGRRRPQAFEAVRLAREASDSAVEESLVEERAVFDRLRLGAESAALRHVFFAERAAGRSITAKGDRPPAVSSAGVVGAGSMGVGIAVSLATHGIPTTLVDRSVDAVSQGLRRAHETIDQAVTRGRLDRGAAQEARAAITPSADLAALAGADVVIEAVFEDLDVKTALLRDLEKVTGSRALLATNTSYLDVEAMADALTTPSRFIGLHFFNPAHLMMLVEVVRASRSDTAAVETGLQLVRRLDKQPVLTGAAEGFVGNRIYSAYRRHAEYLLEDGALPGQVDAAARAFGFAMGPFAVADLAGLQIAWALRREQRSQGRLPARYVDIPDRLCEAGRLGRRSARGYYLYPEDGAGPVEDPWVEQLIVDESARKQITRRAISVEEITTRLLYAMVVEGCAALTDGVASKPGDIDVALIHGFGFPRHTGGPLWWASQQSDHDIREGLRLVADASRTDVPADAVLEMLGRVRSDG